MFAKIDPRCADPSSIDVNYEDKFSCNVNLMEGRSCRSYRADPQLTNPCAPR